jgi:hypothetical protein
LPFPSNIYQGAQLNKTKQNRSFVLMVLIARRAKKETNTKNTKGKAIVDFSPLRRGRLTVIEPFSTDRRYFLRRKILEGLLR